MLMFLFVSTFSVAEEEEEIYVSYCSDYRYTRYYHPELKSYISYSLQQLCLNIPDSTNSNVKYTLPYPPASPMLYSSSFCQKSSVSACQHCLHRAKRTLLHDCNKHVIGAEFYSETCAMRFELYNFFT
ncbi:hypothetical protein LINPERPRIM_LOCUS18723 [Linum perenne]